MKVYFLFYYTEKELYETEKGAESEVLNVLFSVLLLTFCIMAGK
jgi:hypothetical protein